MNLGMKYEALEQKREAIECYTKALEVSDPDARLFLWRGELFYELGEWVEAKRDIEQALNFRSSLPFAELFRDEKKTAERYLAELAKLTSE